MSESKAIVVLGSLDEQEQIALAQALERLGNKFPSVEVIRVATDSGVRRQPLTRAQGEHGASTRANIAIEHALGKGPEHSVFAIGVHTCVDHLLMSDSGFVLMDIVHVCRGDGENVEVPTLGIEVSNRMLETYIGKEKEAGQLDEPTLCERIAERSNGQEAYEYLTNGAISRVSALTDAIAVALAQAAAKKRSEQLEAAA